jgi:ubiquitin carboxyl-terminal hydrolase 48
LRFVYDIESGERRKSKLPLKFYPYLNLHTPARVPGSEDPMEIDDDVLEEHQYELRGVLLHKGQSAYHGHYMAQVYDVR